VVVLLEGARKAFDGQSEAPHRAYFYELWDQYEYSTWEDAVDDFVQRSPDLATAIPAEIDELLTSATDDALASRLDEFGFDHTPQEGVREWLAAVRDRITGQLAD
jgi:hypothetical protein